MVSIMVRVYTNANKVAVVEGDVQKDTVWTTRNKQWDANSIRSYS